MKTPSGIFALVILAVIVIAAVVSCTYQIVPNQKFLLYIGTKPIFGKPTYVNWTTEDEFDDALRKVCQNGGTYKIRKLKADDEEPYDAKSCKEILKTVKVTKSKVAGGALAAESVANDPNVTMKVAAANEEDITTVLNALK